MFNLLFDQKIFRYLLKNIFLSILDASTQLQLNSGLAISTPISTANSDETQRAIDTTLAEAKYLYLFFDFINIL